MLILLDNGHGGLKNGVYTTAPNWDINNPKTWHKMWVHEGVPIFEGVFNRQLTAKIVELSKGKPYEVRLIVPEVEDISLEERVKRVNRVKRTDKIFLSIHGNAFNTSAKGFEVFTSKGETKSDAMADILALEVEKTMKDMVMRWDLSDKDKDKEANLYVLKNTNCPAMLSENGFFDNPIEAKLMMDEKWQYRLAGAYIRAFDKLNT